MSVRTNKLLVTLNFYILENRYSASWTWARETSSCSQLCCYLTAVTWRKSFLSLNFTDTPNHVYLPESI